ncbi:MAG: M4 family metallopeptidase [Nocardioidaceae bacterium]
MTRCQIIPPYLLEKVAHHHPDDSVCDCSRATLHIDARLRGRRGGGPGAIRLRLVTAPGVATPAFAVYTAGNGTALPGRLVRAAGDAASGDAAVDEAYAGVEASLALFREVWGRDSFDGEGAPVVATVHYERDYDNAFWDGAQLVFGDGDGTVFERFTKSVDVLAHEFGHAVTQYSANLTYQGQSGALNESVSDVVGSCVKQRLAGESAAEGDWLIGEGIFARTVRGTALRSMKAPGTGYDDPHLGRDPQVATMADYVETTEDNGGVHINSGIPNRAFYLAATALGGNTWDGAGAIWYSALTSGMAADTDFAGFAAATVAAAEAVSGAARDAVGDAWDEVGVVPVAGGTSRTPGPPDSSRGRVVAVTRTGGVTGARRSGQVTLGVDPRTPEVETLLDRIDLRSVMPHEPRPDRFVYSFDVVGERLVLGEQDLTPDLQRLVMVVLDPPR